MKNKIIITAVIFSFALNIAFVTMWGVHFALNRMSEKTVQSQCVNNNMPCALHRTLGVTDSQWQQIQPELDRFLTGSRNINDSIDMLRYQLINCLSADSVDTIRLGSIGEQMLRMQQKLQDLVISYIRSEKRVFTHKQQKLLYQIIRSKWFCDSNSCCRMSVDKGSPYCEMRSDKNKDR